MRIIDKLAPALFAFGLAGCASDVEYGEIQQESGHVVIENDGQKPLQCVPYAREHSGVNIFGDAYTWWDKADGKYLRGTLPEPGSVMVLNNYAGPERSHVAVVRQLVGSREIRVDHANWLDNGSIYINDPVEDVSSENDWSAVRVYNLKTGGWGGKIYPVQGFIRSYRPDDDRPDLMAEPKLSSNRSGPNAPVGEIN